MVTAKFTVMANNKAVLKSEWLMFVGVGVRRRRKRNWIRYLRQLHPKCKNGRDLGNKRPKKSEKWGGGEGFPGQEGEGEHSAGNVVQLFIVLFSLISPSNFSLDRCLKNNIQLADCTDRSFFPPRKDSSFSLSFFYLKPAKIKWEITGQTFQFQV